MTLVKLKVDGSEEFGWIYVLSNPSFPELLKIGFTLLGHPEERAEQLSSSTSVPYPFQFEWGTVCEHPEKMEQRIHGRLHRYRVNPNREFFKISVDEARIAILGILTSIDFSELENEVPSLYAEILLGYKMMVRYPRQCEGVNPRDPVRSTAKLIRKELSEIDDNPLTALIYAFLDEQIAKAEAQTQAIRSTTK
jgi:hypothetical protein